MPPSELAKHAPVYTSALRASTYSPWIEPATASDVTRRMVRETVAIDFIAGKPPFYRLARVKSFGKRQSCLIQDEPERRACFSHKMSLKRRSGKLGIDHQGAKQEGIEPRTDAGISAGQR